MRIFLWICFSSILTLSACQKNDVVTTDQHVKLSFSTDTVLFDTVFTAVGSVNRRIKVYNTDPKAVSISNIRLGRGNSSFFSLIINGVSVNEKDNVRISGKDSISIFIKATINPSNLNQPFIVEDSVLFNTNGNRQSIALVAYGQNAVFINGETISANTTWGATLPYIINRSVTVAENVTLTIVPGARILFHGNAAMNIRGTLNAAGNVNNQILFAGDRREPYYDNEAGQWQGIRFYPGSTNSRINYALIKNAIIGLTVDSLTFNGIPKLLLSNSTVKNMTVAGVAGYQASIVALNNLFYNCGQYLLYGVGGGSYNLKQNTFVGYNPEFPRRTPALYFSDVGNGRSGNLDLEVSNNIIWGVLTEELMVETKSIFTVNANFKANLIKTAVQTFAANNFLNTDPKFVDAINNNFRLQTISPAINKGISLTTDTYYNSFLYNDMSGATRMFPSELGCFEQQ
ncbi:hypothetical protein ACVWYN_000010 [Pedobacter sp. UYP24]